MGFLCLNDGTWCGWGPEIAAKASASGGRRIKRELQLVARIIFKIPQCLLLVFCCLRCASCCLSPDEYTLSSAICSWSFVVKRQFFANVYLFFVHNLVVGHELSFAAFH